MWNQKGKYNSGVQSQQNKNQQGRESIADQSADILVPNGPSDTISGICMNGTQQNPTTAMFVSSWDSTVCI